MVCYELFKEHRVDREVGSYDAYGLIAKEDKTTVSIIGDITSEYEKALALAALWNEQQLDPLHMEQAVEEFLYLLEV